MCVLSSWIRASLCLSGLLLKAALAKSHHHLMAQLLEEWGACYCKALEKLEVHLLEEQGEEQPSALSAVIWMHMSPCRQQRGKKYLGRSCPHLMREAWTECLGQGMGYGDWRAEHWKDNVSHLLTSPFFPLTSPEDHLQPVIESQDPPV